MRGHRIRLGTFPEPQGQETSEGAGARLAHLPWEPRALTRSGPAPPVHSQCSTDGARSPSPLPVPPTSLRPCLSRPNLAKVTTASTDASPLVHVLVLPSQATPPSPSPVRPPGAHAQPPPPHPVLSCSLVPHDVTHDAKHPHVPRTPTCPSPPRHDPWTPSLFPGTLDPFRSDHWTCPAAPSLSPSVTGRLPSPAAWANLRPRLFPAPSPRGLSATPRQLGAMQLGQPCPGAARPLLPVSLSAASTPPASQGCPHLIPSPSQASCSTRPTSGPRALAGAAPLPGLPWPHLPTPPAWAVSLQCPDYRCGCTFPGAAPLTSRTGWVTTVSARSRCSINDDRRKGIGRPGPSCCRQIWTCDASPCARAERPPE